MTRLRRWNDTEIVGLRRQIAALQAQNELLERRVRVLETQAGLLRAHREHDTFEERFKAAQAESNQRVADAVASRQREREKHNGRHIAFLSAPMIIEHNGGTA